MKKLILIFTIFTIANLAGCSSSPSYKGALLEYKHEKYAAKKDLHSVVAAPDYRYGWCSSNEFDDIRSDRANRKRDGLIMKTAKTIKIAEKEAIKECEYRIGKGECYVYYIDGVYVRVAQRKIWLSKNPSARKEIAKEKAECKAQKKAQASKKTTQVIVSPSKKEPDYAASARMLSIANEALKSTMPRSSPSINCSSIYNPLGYTTTCR